MKNKVQAITLFFFLVIFSGCSSVSFKEVPSSSKTATVYTYVEMAENIDDSFSDPCYKISINKELLPSCMKSEEFMTFDKLKPQSITISAIRNDIDKKSLELTLEAGKTYFLKVQSYSSVIGQFDFEEVSHESALKSISSMKMANPPKKEDEGMFDFFASEDKKKEVEAISSASKMDEIQKASDMKDKGVITQEEFDTLKAEILNK